MLLALCSYPLLGQTIEKKEIDSKILNQKRAFWIYLPNEYKESPAKRFEVIYVLDAQARQFFDVVHSITQFLVGQEFDFIIVGIESPFIKEEKQSRNTDFLPKATHDETIKHYWGYCGGADNFMKFVGDELIPFVDRNYHTLPERIAIGHSNGGTFISYCLLEKPDLFNAYIAISPNYAYDDNQMIHRFEAFGSNKLTTKKFVFISHANERWKGWPEANKKVINTLENEKFNSHIHLVTKDFSATENHGTTFPVGVFYGMKAFIDFQYRTGENVIAYYDALQKNNLINLNEELVNNLAYECFWNNKPTEALKVIQWAIEKYPNGYNLYDSQGEFYESINDYINAAKSYQKAMDALEKEKGKMKDASFKETMNYYKNNYARVNNK